MTDTTTHYGFNMKTQLPYDEAVDRVTAALKEEGFGILTEIDVQATLKKKLDADFRRYVILGACNPHLAQQALTAEIDIGGLLPCNVVVYEDDTSEGSIISIVDPIKVLSVVGNPHLGDVANEVGARLQRVIAKMES